MTEKNTIGIFTSFSIETLCTIDELAERFAGQSRYTAKQYCDFRYSTNLKRFKYDPFTGEEIDWKEVERMIEL